MNEDNKERIERASAGWKTGVTWLARAQIAYELVERCWRVYEARRTYTVTIRSSDNMYQSVHDWLLSILPSETQKAVVVQTLGQVYDDAVDSDDRRAAEAKISLRHNDQRERKVVVGGHEVKVMLLKATIDAMSVNSRQPTPDSIIFTAKTKAAQDAVVKHLSSLLLEQKKGKRRASLWMLNTWGSWSRRDDLPMRPLESVILRDDQLSRITGDLERFLAHEHEYNRRGIPWHRGYLFHGPPGTGKTSLAKALANHFNLDLWYAPLGDLSKDGSLLALLSQVHPRSILLLEDVDVFKATHKEEATSGELSLSGLLNALDGVATPHGLITIMTTNDRTQLDSALLRPGRIDMHEELRAPGPKQAKRLYEYFHGEAAPAGFDPKSVSVAALIEEFKQSMTAA